MTRFSLKRTLQFDLASTIEVLNHLNHDVPKSNLHTPLRYSAVLLRIGKITNICHRNIYLKKIHCPETVTYISAIALKLGKIWQRPVGEIAEMLLSVLQEQTPQPVWSSVRKNSEGWLEFVIAQRGIEQWQQHLHQATLPLSAKVLSYPIEPEMLWQLQSGYELCCRWQACYQHLGTLPQTHSTAPFSIPYYPLQGLVHGLLDICDGWEDTRPSQLLSQARRLVLALETCASTKRPSGSDVEMVSVWFESTKIVLRQLLKDRLGYPLAERF